MERLEATIAGRVQIVMYRAHTQNQARRLGVVGYVMNIPDGTVRVVAEGARPALEQLLEALHRGSFLSEVRSVSPVWKPATGEYSAFTIRYE